MKRFNKGLNNIFKYHNLFTIYTFFTFYLIWTDFNFKTRTRMNWKLWLLKCVWSFTEPTNQDLFFILLFRGLTMNQSRWCFQNFILRIFLFLSNKIIFKKWDLDQRNKPKKKKSLFKTDILNSEKFSRICKRKNPIF